MPDRYVDAVQARRRELRELRERLGGGHRGELRSCLALSRLDAAGDTARMLAELRGEAAEHVQRGDRHARDRLPGHIGEAVAAIATDLTARWAAALGPPLRRIATERGLAMEPGWPRLPAPRTTDLSPPPEPTGPGPSPLAGLVEGAALGRLALLPLAVLPLLGLPALGGPAFAPLAVGSCLAAIVADLDRRLVELERSAAAALDAAVLRRRAAVDRELGLLAAAGVVAGDG